MVRLKERPLGSPGPFTTAEEYLGGFWIIEAADDERAIAWAEQGARALRTRIEVRALQVPPEE